MSDRLKFIKILQDLNIDFKEITHREGYTVVVKSQSFPNDWLEFEFTIEGDFVEVV